MISRWGYFSETIQSQGKSHVYLFLKYLYMIYWCILQNHMKIIKLCQRFLINLIFMYCILLIYTHGDKSYSFYLQIVIFFFLNKPFIHRKLTWLSSLKQITDDNDRVFYFPNKAWFNFYYCFISNKAYKTKSNLF